MPLEQIAELQILAEHIETLMATEALELGRMGTALHAGGQRPAFQAVAAEIPGYKTRLRGARLDDAADRPGGQRIGAQRGQGRGRVGIDLRRQPDAPETPPLP